MSSACFDKVGVVGLGLMGHGICQVSAESGAHKGVIAYEKEQKFLDSGKDRIQKSIDKLVAREKMTPEKAKATLDSITFTTDIGALKDADFIVEAVIENMDLKRDLYSDLGELCKPETIFASNTSSLSITEMSEFSGRQDRFVGIHFFNPVQIMKLVGLLMYHFAFLHMNSNPTRFSLSLFIRLKLFVRSKRIQKSFKKPTIGLVILVK
jgi:3-hydroxyacyl-CoA dehydrogenase